METQMKCIEFSGSNILIKGNTLTNSGWCLFDAFKNGDTQIEIANNTLLNFAHGIMHRNRIGQRRHAIYSSMTMIFTDRVLLGGRCRLPLPSGRNTRLRYDRLEYR